MPFVFNSTFVKKFSFLLICCFLIPTAATAINEKHHIKAWHVVSPIAVADSIPIDTAFINFQDDNPTDRYSIANSYNGNLGSPIQTKIYFLRPLSSQFLFADTYYPYIIKPENITYYNTKTPYSKIAYNGGIATRHRDEDDVKFLFTVNANKKLNFGLDLNYLRAIGKYNNQSGTLFKGALFGSYDGERYSANGGLVFNNIKNYENGGLVNPADIHGPSDPENINVHLQNANAYSGYSYIAFVYNHHYSLGFSKEIQVSEDSVRTDFIPVTRFSHTLKLSDERRRYKEKAADTLFYKAGGPFYSRELTQDSTALRTISNVLAVSIEEEFNKWMRFGLSAYIANDIEQYTIMTDSATWGRKNEIHTKVGGVLSKQQGKRFKYNINAEFNILGPEAGDFNIGGNVGGYFRLWKDSMTIIAKGFVRNESPSFFIDQYRSNHFQWENDFNRTFRTQIGGILAIPTRSFALDVTVENITNHIYFGNNFLPTQHSGNIQVFSANLKQNFRLWKIHLENNVVYQASSDQKALPLPTLSLYHNLYYQDLWFKVLSIQAGVDLRYNTAYYAPLYMPATGQFATQDEVKIGNFPVMNVYLNFHLKQVRFFVKWYHFNSLFMENDYFSMPNYPINPAVFRVGLSWNFYN